MATRAGMRARSYHASPGEVRSVGGVHKLVDELCKYPGWWCDAGRHGDFLMATDMPGEPSYGPARGLAAQMRGDLIGCGKIRKAVATLPAPDSYPHVICG